MMLVPQSFVSATMSRDWGIAYTITSVRDQHQLMIVRGTQAIHGCVQKWRIPQNGSFDGDADKQWFLCLYLYLWGTWSLDYNYTIFTCIVLCYTQCYFILSYVILQPFDAYIYIVLYTRHLFYEWYILIWGHIHIIYIYMYRERVKPELWSFGPGFMADWVCLIHGQVPPAPSRAVAAVARCLAGVISMGYIVTTMIQI